MTAIVLILLIRGRGKEFYLTLGGAGFLILALASWMLFVAPVNMEMLNWFNGQPIPADFNEWRNQWEYAHAVNAFIKIFGFSFLILSVLTEPEKRRVL